MSLGILILTTNDSPKFFGVLIFIAGIGYSLVHVLGLLYKGSSLKNNLETAFMLPQIIGELGLGIWLLIKGGIKQQH